LGGEAKTNKKKKEKKKKKKKQKRGPKAAQKKQKGTNKPHGHLTDKGKRAEPGKNGLLRRRRGE